MPVIDINPDFHGKDGQNDCWLQVLQFIRI